MVRILTLVAFALITIATPAAPEEHHHQAALSQSTTASAVTADTIDELLELPQLHQGHSILLRLYWAVLDRKPELGGAIFWIDSYDSGAWDIRRIAAHFVVSQEFQDVYGNKSNAEFVTLIYNNMLDRDPDNGGFTFWTGQLDTGMSRAEMVLLVSNDTEFINRRPLPSDARPNTGPGPYVPPRTADTVAAEALEFFRGTETICAAHSDRTGNPTPDPQRFAEAMVVDVATDLERVTIQDGLGDQLVVDFALPLDAPDRFGSTEPTVVYAPAGPTAQLPLSYSFGCPPDLYLGTADA